MRFSAQETKDGGIMHYTTMEWEAARWKTVREVFFQVEIQNLSFVYQECKWRNKAGCWIYGSNVCGRFGLCLIFMQK